MLGLRGVKGNSMFEKINEDCAYSLLAGPDSQAAVPVQNHEQSSGMDARQRDAYDCAALHQ